MNLFHPTILAVTLLCMLPLFPGQGAEATAPAPAPMPLWPAAIPGEKGPLPPEKDTTKPGDNLIAGKPVIRLGNVSIPTLTVFPAPREKANGSAVVVCPGGGYHILAMDLEGTEICEWLNSIGVTAVLLKYRVPVRPGQERYLAPLQDAQRALGLTRQHARDWNIDPQRIGILGFSAGGHLSAAASTMFEKRSYEGIDEADRLSCRPDFAVLIYPGYLAVKKPGQGVSPELTITSNTPPTFLVQTQDDAVGIENTLHYAMALQQAKVPFSMHVYPTGGHGYGLRPSEQAVTTWPSRVEEWMRQQGWLKRP